MKNRFSAQHRPIDWPELIKDLNKNLTYKEVGDICGLSSSTISNISNDLKPHPKEWDTAFLLIDLWMRLGNKNLPTY